MRLDALRTRPEVEPLSDRLWRRYGRRAFDLLEMVRADPTMGQDVMGSTDYLRAELYTAAEQEMVVTLDDFMRRRRRSTSWCTTATSSTPPGCRRWPRSCSVRMPSRASPSTSADPDCDSPRRAGCARGPPTDRCGSGRR